MFLISLTILKLIYLRLSLYQLDIVSTLKCFTDKTALRIQCILKESTIVDLGPRKRERKEMKEKRMAREYSVILT